MTTPATAQHTPGPQIILQPDQDSVRLPCGCTLEREHPVHADPAMTLCSMHAAAPALLAALESVYKWIREPDNPRRWEMLSYVHDHVGAAIRAARGK
jgi:hypothetical protein